MFLKSKWRWVATATAVAALGSWSVATVPAASAAGSGSLNVLLPGVTGGTWNTLDPLTDATAAANWDVLNPIYGELFEQGSNGKIVPDLATGYKISDGGLKVTIDLRPGVTFSDGTAFNAAAVVFNLKRDLDPKAACLCLENFSAVTSESAAGPHKVVLNLSHPDPAIIDAFIWEAPNWIISPTAFAKEGAKNIGMKPVGAGPFTVTQAIPNTKLALTANPHYWQAGYPKVKNLTFTSVNSDASALQAMQAGNGEVYTALTSVTNLASAQKSFTVAKIPSTSTLSINLNPRIAPFNNIKAREAIYYATDAAAINKTLFNNTGLISETPSGPGDLYFADKVPGYRNYDLAKAKALVKQLGGLKLTLSSIPTPVYTPLVTAYKSLWAAAGIDATLQFLTIPQIVKETENGTMQAIATQAGSFDPALLPGLGAWYSSKGPFSLVRDPALDKLIDTAASDTKPSKAATDYKKIYSYLNQKAYTPFVLAAPSWRVQSKAVTGIPANVTEVPWQDVAVKG
ncbi:MAG: ABC transporter substrate-binding protein [Acidimicrobiaceae bacterium]|nr:ABC transporter substrate-binding protein [Acidimicrobiaceae bacterium]